MTDIKKYEPLWGAWYVNSLIGEGSFGKVYKVRREEFGKTYYSAVKLITIPQNEADLRQIRGEGMDDASLRSYFHAFVTDIIQEIDLMSEFKGNSNIVSFEDHKVLEKTDGFGWDILIRMELLTSLTEHVTHQSLTQDEVIKLGIHICRALELCAAHNTIHRDIKPDNIFVSKYGDYKLGDFGIARQIERTSSGLSKKGTYTYMAPEVFTGQEYGANVDMYSLGIVMYRFLNQNRTPILPDFPSPITPRDRDEALNRRMKGEPLAPINGINPELNAIVLRACEFDRGKRFASPTDMRKALELLIGEAINAPVIAQMAVSENKTAERTTSSEKTDGIFTDRPEQITATGKGDPFGNEYSQSWGQSAMQEPSPYTPHMEHTERTEGVFTHTPMPEIKLQEAPPKRSSNILVAILASCFVTTIVVFGFLFFIGTRIVEPREVYTPNQNLIQQTPTTEPAEPSEEPVEPDAIVDASTALLEGPNWTMEIAEGWTVDYLGDELDLLSPDGLSGIGIEPAHEMYGLTLDYFIDPIIDALTVEIDDFVLLSIEQTVVNRYDAVLIVFEGRVDGDLATTYTFLIESNGELFIIVYATENGIDFFEDVMDMLNTFTTQTPGDTGTALLEGPNWTMEIAEGWTVDYLEDELDLLSPDGLSGIGIEPALDMSGLTLDYFVDPIIDGFAVEFDDFMLLSSERMVINRYNAALIVSEARADGVFITFYTFLIESSGELFIIVYATENGIDFFDDVMDMLDTFTTHD